MVEKHESLRPGLKLDLITERRLAKTHKERERGIETVHEPRTEHIEWTQELAEQALAITKPRTT